MPSRRTFLSTTGLAAGASLGFSPLSTPLSTPLEFPEDSIEQLAGKTVLFQGDSITDAGRNRNGNSPNNAASLGPGYPGYIASYLLGKFPYVDMNFYNKGISGNKVFQLAERWDADCLVLKPDIVSILIGVNDYWHTLTHGYGGTVETYENDLRTLLHNTEKSLPNVSFIIGEPFVLNNGTSITDAWNLETFDEYRYVARIVANDFDAKFIPYQTVFNKALKDANVSHWCPDGVHPSPAGNYLMAKAWLKAFNKG